MGLLVLVLTAAFLGSAGVLVGPSLQGVLAAGQRLLVRDTAHGATQAPPAPGGGPTPLPWAAGGPALSRDELDVVLSYADSLRPDDPLVEVRPGVSAKRSNVEGVRLGGRTVYYDLSAHQSFGPLRAGKATPADVVVLARQGQGDFELVVYALKRGVPAGGPGG
jgi:hypothetical protein